METIFARASAQGKAGVSLIRLSGPHAFACAERMVGFIPKPRVATLAELTGEDKQIIPEWIRSGAPVTVFDEPSDWMDFENGGIQVEHLNKISSILNA